MPARKVAKGAAKARMPGAAWRDSAYGWAGGLGKKGRNTVPGSHEQRVLGRARLRNTAIGAGGLGAVNKMRSPRSSGRDGLQPHSSGAAQNMYM